MGGLWIVVAVAVGYLIGRRSRIVSAIEASWKDQDARFLDELRKASRRPPASR